MSTSSSSTLNLLELYETPPYLYETSVGDFDVVVLSSFRKAKEILTNQTNTKSSRIQKPSSSTSASSSKEDFGVLISEMDDLIRKVK